ncbi:MAG: AAA family ATPase [Candidatus Aminicenantes bacterium]|nr:AAA family ATPase [Candidatus Aminicenantes bacterium]
MKAWRLTPAARELRIGLTGRMASGKGEAVRIMKSYGFQYISLSDIVRREAAKIGPALDRGQMQSGEPEGGQQVGPTMALADFTIANEGPLSELKTALDAILRKIGVGHA